MYDVSVVEEHTDGDIVELASELVVQSARLIRMVRRQVDQPAGLRVLAILDERGPLGLTALAQADRCSQPTMSGTVATLHELGHVDRAAKPGDGRTSIISLTSRGRTALAEARRHHGALIAERLDATGHSPAELGTAVAVLRDLLALDPLTSPAAASPTNPAADTQRTLKGTPE